MAMPIVPPVSGGVGDPGKPWETVDVQALIAAGLTLPETTILQRRDGFHLFYAAKPHIVFGEAESLKTWLVLFAAYQEIKKGNSVLYVDYEMTPVVVLARLLSFDLTEQEVIRHLVYIQPSTPMEQATQDYLDGLFTDYSVSQAITLTIVDSVTGAMTQQGLDANKGHDTEALYQNYVRFFTSRDSAVVMLDHVTKSKDSRGGMAIGSERKQSGLDGAAYEIRKDLPFGRGKHGRSYLFNRKDRDGAILARVDRERNAGAFHIVSDPTTGKVDAWIDLPASPSSSAGVASSGGFKFTPAQLQQVLVKVAGQPGCTQGDAYRGISGLSMAKKGGAAVNHLIEHGFLRNEGTDRAMSLHFVRNYDVKVEGLEDT